MASCLPTHSARSPWVASPRPLSWHHVRYSASSASLRENLSPEGFSEPARSRGSAHERNVSRQTGAASPGTQAAPRSLVSSRFDVLSRLVSSRPVVVSRLISSYLVWLRLGPPRLLSTGSARDLLPGPEPTSPPGIRGVWAGGFREVSDRPTFTAPPSVSRRRHRRDGTRSDSSMGLRRLSWRIRHELDGRRSSARRRTPRQRWRSNLNEILVLPTRSYWAVISMIVHAFIHL